MDQHSRWEIPIVVCDSLADFEILLSGGAHMALHITALLASVNTSKLSAEFLLVWESH